MEVFLVYFCPPKGRQIPRRFCMWKYHF